MNYIFADGHAIPPHEVQAHIFYDWCACEPVAMFDPFGRMFWRHQPFDISEELWEQAEALRMAESARLWEQAEKADPTKNFTVIPFPSMKPIQLPAAKNRN